MLAAKISGGACAKTETKCYYDCCKKTYCEKEKENVQGKYDSTVFACEIHYLCAILTRVSKLEMKIMNLKALWRAKNGVISSLKRTIAASKRKMEKKNKELYYELS